MRSNFISIRMTVITFFKKRIITNVGKDVEKRSPHTLLVGTQNNATTLESFAVSLKVKNKFSKTQNKQTKNARTSVELMSVSPERK